jgi:hypothetical protein
MPSFIKLTISAIYSNIIVNIININQADKIKKILEIGGMSKYCIFIHPRDNKRLGRNYG